MSILNQHLPSFGSPYKRQTPTLWQAIGQSVWRALQIAGQRRAAPELLRLAQRWEAIDPALAQQFRDATRFDTSSH